MDREDLELPEAAEVIRRLNALIYVFKMTGLPLSSWHGVPMTEETNPKTDSRNVHHYENYTPLPGAADDPHFPWFLYWENFWTLKHTPLSVDDWILDAGGACSLFSAYLSSLGYKVFSVELSKELVMQANFSAINLNWDSFAFRGDLSDLSMFGDRMFNAAFSICVFEHLDHELRVKAIKELGRVLKPGGYLSMTFDYKNPCPAVWKPTSPLELNLISTPEQIRSNLMDPELFEIRFNKEFHDNGKLYLGHPRFNYLPYTFGSLFLQRR